MEDVAILTLGDSYASGEGNPHWPAFFKDARHQEYNNEIDQWWDRRCHRSLLSYSSQAVAVAALQTQLRTDEKKYSFTLLNYAGSGAEIRKSTIVKSPAGRPYYSGGILDRYEGRETKEQLKFFSKKYGPKLAALEQARQEEPLLSQIDQAKRDLCVENVGGRCVRYRHPNFVVVSIGGNDVGFGPIMIELINKCERTTTLDGRHECATKLVKDRIEKDLKPGMDALASALMPIMNEKTTVLLTQYPDVTSAKPTAGSKAKEQYCDDYNFERMLGPERLSSVGWWLPIDMRNILINKAVTATEARWAYENVLKPLNGFLANFAKERSPKWKLLGGIEAMSKGRGWCSRPSWFINFEESKAKQGVLPRDGSLDQKFTTAAAHPNLYGHDFMAWRLRCHFADAGIIPRDKVYANGAGKCEAP